jgi:hypothetical protein
MGLQIQLMHQVYGPIGVLGFYDVGKVGLKTSDLDFDGFHHAFGVGLYFTAGNVVVFRLSVGFGTGEGTLLNTKAASAMF